MFLKKSFAFLAAGLLSLSLIGSSTVYGADGDESVTKDSSGNWFGAGELIDISSYADGEVKNELFEAGMNVIADNVTVGGSVFIAGNRVSISGSEIGGSVFAAGQNVIIDSSVNNNIWAAGNNITIGGNTSVQGLHVAGASIAVSGAYDGVDIAGEKVVFDGTATGDVFIEAESVTIGKNAVIEGELKVKSVNEAEISDGASVSKYTYVEVKQPDEENDDSESGEALRTAGKAAAGLTFLKKLRKVIFNMIKFSILAVIFAFVFKKNLNDSYEYATKKPGALWGFGALALICVPIVAIILCVTVIGIPVAGLILALYALSLCFARVFTFTSLVKELIFSHTAKRLNPVAEAVLAVLPAAILKEIPVVGGVTGFACAIYTVGYVLLAIVYAIKSNRNPKMVEENAEANPT